MMLKPKKNNKFKKSKPKTERIFLSEEYQQNSIVERPIPNVPTKEYSLPTASPEQEEIILNFKNGFNIKIAALAGSGKTTTLLLLSNIAKNDFGSKSMILTYNRTLKDEIEQRIQHLRLQSFCKTYTYHGLASKLYGKTINNDV